MTSPEPIEQEAEVIGVPPAAPEPVSVGDETGEGGNAIVGWARAIALGIRDTAHDVVEEGRKGAREAYEEGWERFEDKTKRRRERD